jgi:chromosome segregation ATPase
MKAFVAILFFVTIGTSLANTAVYQALAEIDKDPFGSTLLNAIALNLRAKTPISEVSGLLNTILDDLLADSQNLDTTFQNTRDSLTRSINDGVSLIDSFTNTINSLKDSITSDTENRNSKQTSLANTEAALAYEENRIKELEASYAATVPNADADISDLSAAITAINNAISRMEAYRASAGAATALLEVSSNTQKDMKKVADTIQRMKKTLSKRSNLYTPLVRELLDLTANVEQGKADRVIDLLNQLLELLRQAHNDVQTFRASFIAAYETDKKNAQDHIIEYKGTIAQLSADIDGLNTRIAQAEGDLATTTDLRNSAQAKLDSDRKALDDATNFYNDQRPRYDRILELVRRIIDYFNTNVAAVDEYTRTQINQL